MSVPSSPRPSRADRDPGKVSRQRAALERYERSEVAYAKQYAHRMECLADLAEAFEDEHPRELQQYVAGIGRMGQGSAQTTCRTARRLRENFPQALQLLKQGEIRVRTVEILLRITTNASDQVQAELGRRVVGQVVHADAADVNRLVSAVLPEVEAELEEAAQRRRHEQAKANRGFYLLPTADGMARIGVDTDLLSAARFATGFEQLDRAEVERDRRDGIKRTAGQRRADLLTELPARHLALLAAVQQGTTDALLAEAAQRNAEALRVRAAAALGVEAPVQHELDLGVPPAGPARAWQLDPCELAVQLLRVPVDAQTVLNLHVPATTVLDLDQRAMRLDIAGYCYLPAFHARLLLPDVALRRVLVDHLTGIPIAGEQLFYPPPEKPLWLDMTDHPHSRRRRACGCAHTAGCRPPAAPRPSTAAEQLQRQQERALHEQRQRIYDMTSLYVTVDEAEPQHDPSNALRAFVQLRDQTSRGIGCNVLARRADLDHREDYAKGGPTAAWNLDPQGKRSHHSKDNGWVPSRDERTGIMTWTSPLELVFTRRPGWDPPKPIDPDATIPQIATDPAPEVPRDREDDDRPIWQDPTSPTSPPSATQTAQSEPDRTEKAPRPRKQFGDDGPPPF